MRAGIILDFFHRRNQCLGKCPAHGMYSMPIFCPHERNSINRYHMLKVYHASGTVPTTSYTSFHLILRTLYKVGRTVLFCRRRCSRALNNRPKAALLKSRSRMTPKSQIFPAMLHCLKIINMCIYICTYTSIFPCIYVYIYIHT